MRALRTRPNTWPLAAPQASLRTAVPRAPNPQSGAHDLTGVFVASSLNLLGDEAVKFVGQTDVPGRHGDGPFCRCDFRNHHDWQTLPIVRSIGRQSYCRETLSCDSLVWRRKDRPEFRLANGEHHSKVLVVRVLSGNVQLLADPVDHMLATWFGPFGSLLN